MLDQTAARASQVLALNIEDLGLDARRAPIRSKGGDTEWICWGSAPHLLPRLIRGRQAGPVFLSERRPGPARRPNPGLVPGDWTGLARLRPRPDPVHPAHRVAAAPAPPLRSDSPRRTRHPAAADHAEDPAPEPAHRDAVRPPRRRSRRFIHRPARTSTPTRLSNIRPRAEEGGGDVHDDMMMGAATTPIGGHRFAGHLTRQPWARVVRYRW